MILHVPLSPHPAFPLLGHGTSLPPPTLSKSLGDSLRCHSTKFYPSQALSFFWGSCHRPDPALLPRLLNGLSTLSCTPCRSVFIAYHCWEEKAQDVRHSGPLGSPFLGLSLLHLSSMSNPGDCFASCHLGATGLILQDSTQMSCPQ